MAEYIPRGSFPKGPTFSLDKQFGELELIGSVMSYNYLSQSFWERIGEGGSITSAPAFWNDLILFGACDRNFYCLDSDGNEKWKVRIDGVILCDASINDGIVFFGSTDSNVYAVDYSNGEILWKFPTRGPVIGFLLVRDGTVYTGSTDSNIYGIDEKTGMEVLRIPGVGTQTGISERDGVLYFGYEDRVFYAYHLKNRSFLWTFKTQKGACGWKENFWKGNVYIGSFEGNIYGLNGLGGQLLWKFSAGNVAFPPCTSGGRLYFGSMDFNVYGLDAETGKLLWKFRTGGLVGNVTESQGRVYFGSYDNNVYCVDASSGKELWRFRTSGFVNKVSCNGGMVYAGSWDCHLYCLDASTGKLIWKFRASLGTPSRIEPPETGIIKTAEIIWSAPSEEGKEKYKTGPGTGEYSLNLSQYAVTSEYAQQSPYKQRKREF